MKDCQYLPFGFFSTPTERVSTTLQRKGFEMTTTIPLVSLDCVNAVMDKSMSVPMSEFGVEMLDEMLTDQPHLMQMISFLITNLIAKGKPEEIAAHDAVQTMCVIGVVFKAIKAQVEAEELEGWAEAA